MLTPPPLTLEAKKGQILKFCKGAKFLNSALFWCGTNWFVWLMPCEGLSPIGKAEMTSLKTRRLAC